MARKAMVLKQHKLIQDVRFAADRMLTLESLVFAVYALENWLTKVKSLA